jgi:hypothetical protein
MKTAQLTPAINKLPSLEELVNDSEVSIKENNLMVLLNQPPPKNWIKSHPTTKGDYLPIERVEYLLNRIYGKWWVDIKNCYSVANSVVVIVRLHVTNPVTGEEQWQDGVGAAPIQTDSGKGAMDWNYAKAHGVMIAAPSAETYAIKDAAEKFGKLFGKDLNRKEEISYEGLLKAEPVSFEIINELWEVKKASVPADQFQDCQRIIDNKEKKSFNKLYKYLQGL